MPHENQPYPYNTPEHSWYLHIDDPTRDRDGPTIIHADFHVQTPPVIRTGEDATFDFVFGVKSRHREHTNPVRHFQQYRALREMAHYAGDFTTFETPAGRIAYREQTPADAPSILIGVEPGYSTPVGGCWGVLSNVEDTSPRPEQAVELSLSVHVIAPFDEFETYHDVVTERER